MVEANAWILAGEIRPLFLPLAFKKAAWAHGRTAVALSTLPTIEAYRAGKVCPPRLDRGYFDLFTFSRISPPVPSAGIRQAAQRQIRDGDFQART